MTVEEALARADREQLRAALQRALDAAGLLPAADTALPPGTVEGTLRFLPREEGLAPKDVRVDDLLHKVEMMRDKLRVDEQRINASAIPAAEKLALQARLAEAYRVLSSVGPLLRVKADTDGGQP